MDLSKLFNPNEKPLDRLLTAGGFCSIFRTIGCIGDSISSGEFESRDADGKKDYHDMFDYSWGQFLARFTGSKVYNFSRGGMRADWYLESFADEMGYWDPALACQAYIVGLGVNDLLNHQKPLGTVDDGFTTPDESTFSGCYQEILRRYREIQPDAKFFLSTIARGNPGWDATGLVDGHAELIRQIAAKYPNTYVLDMNRYSPSWGEMYDRFFLGFHMTACGYAFTAQMFLSYIDYIVRMNMQDFKEAGFIGTGLHYIEDAK